ncbi:MAG: helix-turn-helix transcriptional regulator [Flavobacteriales bacterium]|nr:helix-turn-helix transcriptional regulator [Flavobacteriales bacterium]
MKNNVKKLRKECNLTLQDIADITGLSKSYLCELEKGKYCPSLRYARVISNALNNTMDKVFPDEWMGSDHGQS